jgi:hypothetical protein
VVLHSEPGLPITASLQPETLAVGGRVATLEETVGATSIDDFCEQQGIGAVDLLKIDVEGLELDVLRGASRLLARDAVSLIQFEFGYGTVAARAYMRDFYELLAPTHTLHRVAPRGLIALGEYRLAHEIFVGMTNYVAVPRRMGERR